MFTKGRISELLDLYKTSDNYIFKQEPYNGRPFMSRDLIEAKMLVDRWGENSIITEWIFHISQKETVLSALKESISESCNSLNFVNALSIIAKSGKDFNFDINNLSEKDLHKIMNAANDAAKVYNIWGARIHFINDIDPNLALGLSLNDDGTLSKNGSGTITNSIVVFKVQD